MDGRTGCQNGSGKNEVLLLHRFPLPDAKEAAIFLSVHEICQPAN
jgi:hypothetical protein